MDDDTDNPWGNPSPSPHATPLPPVADDELTSPMLDFDESPGGGWDDAGDMGVPPPAEEPKLPEPEPEHEVDTVEEGEQQQDKKKKKKKKKKNKSKQVEEDTEEDEEEPASGEAPPPDEEPAPASVDDEPVPEPLPPASPPPPTTMIASPSFSAVSSAHEGPPMDDFDDEPAAATVNDGFDDEFDDFGEPGAAGADDDDFGDFGGDDDAFGGAPVAASAFEEVPVPVPVASTSYVPPLQVDLSTPTRSALAPQLASFFASVYPVADEVLSDEPERQVDGIGQVLVTESSRSLLTTLSSLPALKPLDWRRSKVRKEALVSLGIPVNLDDSADAKPLAEIRRKNASIPPPLDRKRAAEICALGEGDLTLYSLAKLKALKEELEKISIDASGLLTHALLMREKETGDTETYNGMIQDLVSAAAKMKTSTTSRPSLSRSNSGRGKWGQRKSSGGPAATNATASLASTTTDYANWSNATLAVFEANITRLEAKLAQEKAAYSSFRKQLKSVGGKKEEEKIKGEMKEFAREISVAEGALTRGLATLKKVLEAKGISSTTKVTTTTKTTTTAKSSTTSVAKTSSTTTSAPASTSTASGTSTKKGLGYNTASLTDAFGDSISWVYNWAAAQDTSTGTLTEGVEYVPMLTEGWSSNAQAGIDAGATALLGFNEPDYPYQANLTASEAATLWKANMEPFYGKAKLISPAISNGGAPMGVTWMKEFIGNCSTCHIDAIAAHWYDVPSNTAYFKNYFTSMSTMFGLPIWITEFAPNTGTDAEIEAFYEDVISWMETGNGSTIIERYAAFGDFAGTFVNADGSLTSLGETYMNTVGSTTA
ncbi:Glycoside hydrolase, superfamily [Pseudohyphozyma bogoriensis]|nr:Glycoside hydrolase, superfamily [Pseudohyphozyma bogoriensis]